MNKTAIITLLTTGAIAVVGGIAYFSLQNKEQGIYRDTDQRQQSGRLVRECPEHWYYNAMPGPAEGSSKEKQYFIINGQRVDFDQVDVEWVKQNCQVNEPEYVH